MRECRAGASAAEPVAFNRTFAAIWRERLPGRRSRPGSNYSERSDGISGEGPPRVGEALPAPDPEAALHGDCGERPEWVESRPSQVARKSKICIAGIALKNEGL